MNDYRLCESIIDRSKFRKTTRKFKNFGVKKIFTEKQSGNQ